MDTEVNLQMASEGCLMCVYKVVMHLKKISIWEIWKFE